MRFTHLTKPLARLLRPAQPAGSPVSAPADKDTAAVQATVTAAQALATEAEAATRTAVIRDLESGAIDAPTDLARLAVTGASSRIRQLAAQRIADPALLKDLLKETRGRDNGVYKIIKQKCDALRAVEQHAAAQDAEVEEFCVTLERHARRAYDSFYLASLQGFDNRWRELQSQALPQAQARVIDALDQCREVIAGHVRLQAEHAVLESQRAALAAAELEAAAVADSAEQQRAATAALAAAEANRSREAEARARTERLAREAERLHQIGGLTGKALGALRDGSTARAAGLRRAIEEKLEAAPTLPSPLAAQLHKLDAQLQDLKEWKDYAVAPKRAGLIEAMEALIGADAAPQAVAERIKRLQDDWKTISKGVVSDSEADWQRFHQAAQTAYQPCREYFEAQAKLREENLRGRSALLERLQTFESTQDLDSPDFRLLATVLREAPREWRRHTPVERSAGLAVQTEFDATLGRLRARLDSWHAQNEKAKRGLIERAQQLCGQDGRDAVDALKRLQLQWKDIGAAARDLEPRLWEEFRTHCDTFFEKRQKSHAEHGAALEAHKAQAVALCVTAEEAAVLGGPASLTVAAQIPAWRDAFDAVGELPRGDERGLRQRFGRAVELCLTQAAEQRGRERERTFLDVLEAARHIQAYAWAVTRNDAPADRDSLKLAAETFIAGIAHWPKTGTQALAEAWAKAAVPQAVPESDLTARQTALRTLCIRSEILTEQPTPPEDHALRREYQVQRLMQKMGQGVDAGTDGLDALVWEWVRVGAVPPATHESLLARFLESRGSRHTNA